jgi:hypothetical protein
VDCRAEIADLTARLAAAESRVSEPAAPTGPDPELLAKIADCEARIHEADNRILDLQMELKERIDKANEKEVRFACPG